MPAADTFLGALLSSPWWTAIMTGLLAIPLFAGYRAAFRHRMAQPFRTAGPEHHKAKGLVPTGSGIVITLLLLVAGIVILPYAEWEYPSQRLGVYVCWAAALMGLLGFLDDELKVKRGSEGLKARYKFPVQIVVGLGLLYLLSTYFATLPVNPAMPWPITAPWWLYYPAGLFVWLGAVNGANFTDGVDGLLGATTLVVLGGIFLALLDGSEPLAVPAAVGCGLLVAFLILNWKPALIYMGDSGSLAVGALVAGLFMARGWWFFLGLCVVVWVLEVGSVMLQVGSYRLTRRRVFLMSPLHHHFELAGWGERTIVLVFSLLQVLGCVTAFAWLRYGVHWGLAGMTLLLGIVGLLLLRYHKRVR